MPAISLDEAYKKARQLKQQKQIIILVTGVFDLLHIEHIRFLTQAKKCGGYVFVGLESDRRVRQLKGPDRPVNSSRVRLEQVACLKPVDYCFPLPPNFSTQSSWEQFIDHLKPDIYAVSSHTQYLDNKQKILARVGGQVKVIYDYNPAISTSLLIAKLLNPHLSADKQLFTSPVKPGFGRGVGLGFPTLNLHIPPNFPFQHGIYAGWVWLSGKKYQGAFHYGPIPSFELTQPSLEVFVLNAPKKLQTPVTVDFTLMHYLRPIKHFIEAQDLTHQIALDVTLTQTLLSTNAT